MNIRIYKYFGICKRFQGIGFIISFDEPKLMDDKRYLIEIKLFWLRGWVMFEFKNTQTR